MRVGYVTLGTNDLERACAFYDALMGSIEFTRIWEDGKLFIWGRSMEEAAVGVTVMEDLGACRVAQYLGLIQRSASFITMVIAMTMSTR